MFGSLKNISLFRTMMMTVKQYAEKRGKPVATVYSWIDRGKAEKNGFRVVQIGNVKLIEELKTKK